MVSPQRIPETLLSLSRDGFYALDLNQVFIYWSAGMQRITGMLEREVIGRNAFDVFPFLHERGQEQIFETVLTGETVNVRSWPFAVPESGKTGFVNSSYSPYRDANGKIVGILAIVTDITEEKKTLAIREEMETRFKNMADSSPVMLWMSGKDALCNFFNQSWLQFSGKTMEQELGVGWAEGVHAFDFQRCMDIYLEHFNERKPFEMEYRLLRNDGEYRWILDRGIPRYSHDGIFQGYIGSCIDITERKMLEDELRKSIRLREEFLSIASHELKTPLTSVGLQIQMFQHLLQNPQDANKLEKQVRPIMEIADRQLRHMGDMIEKLLDVSRIEIGIFKTDPSRMDLAEAIREVVKRMSIMAEQVACTITVSGEKSVIGDWDRSRIEQVVSNLLLNAIRYAPGAPVNVRIEKHDDVAIFEVEDGGQGIDKASWPKLFEKFQRGSQDHKGLGLGLFVSKQIVKSHGGEITVENAPNKGALFRVRLPIIASV